MAGKGGKAGNKNSSFKRGKTAGGSSKGNYSRYSSEAADIEARNREAAYESDDNKDLSEEDEEESRFDDLGGLILKPEDINVRICLWEFGQNDPKRDSGSKLCKLGYSDRLKIGQNFNGIVLSSEATSFVSPADLEIVEKYGIAGINCSWNRLEDIPFSSLGKLKNHRKLPLIVAANTVNYGKPFKMNTAEALAATLYIVGFKKEAISLLYPFSYGVEFIKLNEEAMNAYSGCANSQEVEKLMNYFIEDGEKQKLEKNIKKSQNETGNNGGYLDDMDLPPMDSDNDYDYYYEEGNVEENPN